MGVQKTSAKIADIARLFLVYDTVRALKLTQPMPRMGHFGILIMIGASKVRSTLNNEALSEIMIIIK